MGICCSFWGALADVVRPFAGNRTSIEEDNMNGPEDETTVVEPEQGNGMCCEGLRRCLCLLTVYRSALSYHFTAAAWCGLEQSRAANFHLGAKEHARKNYEVNLQFLRDC